MGGYVRLTKQGLLEFDYDSESQSYLSQPVSQDRIFATLRLSCKIDPGVTLLDIFNTVANYPALTGFLAQYSWCFAIQEFHEAAQRPAAPTTLKRLEISRYVQTHTYDDVRHLSADICDALDFTGVGPLDEHGNTRYGVSLSPMNMLANLPVTLNTTCEIHHNFEKVSEWETGFSLLEVLDAIYDDISFHGGPEENEAFLRGVEWHGRRH